VTIGVAWIRGAADRGQLWIASDSRLSGDGSLWDECPKIFVLSRQDVIAAFSGTTSRAYPLLLQFDAAIRAYQPSLDGEEDFFALLGHLERVARTVLGSPSPDPLIRGTAHPTEFADAGDSIVIGGFTRDDRRLVVRVLKYERTASGWQFSHVRPDSSLGNRVILVFGDSSSRRQFRFTLRLLLKERRGSSRVSLDFDLEPLEALGRLLRLPEPKGAEPVPGTRPRTIGGAPQAARTMAGARATHFVVRWSTSDGDADFMLGRRCLPYENPDLPLAAFSADGVELYARHQWTPFRREPT
jgi:hypothetical protein